MKKKLLIISILTAISISTVFTGCGSNTATNTTNINQNAFNEATAKTDSKKALESFLNSHKDNDVLVNSTDKEQIKSYVNKNFRQYFTSDFLNDTNTQIESGSINDNNTFYLYHYPNSINFKSDYYVYSPTIDNQNKTVTYEIKENAGMTYYVQMKIENGRWKINKVNEY